MFLVTTRDDIKQSMKFRFNFFCYLKVEKFKQAQKKKKKKNGLNKKLLPLRFTMQDTNFFFELTKNK